MESHVPTVQNWWSSGHKPGDWLVLSSVLWHIRIGNAIKVVMSEICST